VTATAWTRRYNGGNYCKSSTELTRVDQVSPGKHDIDFGCSGIASKSGDSSMPNHARIHELFSGSGRKIIPINLQYTVRKNRRVTEHLITNCKYLPEPEEDQFISMPIVDVPPARIRKAE